MRKRRKDPLLYAGLGFLLLLVVMAIFGPTFRHDYLTPIGSPHATPNSQAWLGTDALGRDIFARLCYGARISLYVGLSVQLISLTVGVLMAVIGTFSPIYVRVAILRFTDAMFAFPDILLALLLVAIVPGSRLMAVILALSVTAWPAVTRLVVTQLASLKDREYVTAARAMGGSTFYIVTRHIMGQLWGILLAVSMVDLAGTILGESTLSFLGIGIQAPDPSWGSMIDMARNDMNSHPIELLWPCLLLSLTIFALNFVGDGLRAILDPKSQ